MTSHSEPVLEGEAQPEAPGCALARRARQATGLGQAAFSRALGLHHTTVWYWEHGQRVPNRRMRAVLRLVEAFPQRAVEILEQEGEVSRGARRWRVSRKRILAAIRELGVGPRLAVPLDRLRDELDDAPRDKLDAMLLTMEGEGRIELEPPQFPACLSEGERAALLNHPAQGQVLFVKLPEER